MDTFAHIETPKRAYKGDRFEARSEDVPLGDIAFRYRNASDEIAARPLEGCGTVSLVPANSAAVSSAKPMPSHGSEPLPFRPLTKGALGRLDVAHGRYTLSVSLREDTKLAPCDALISGAPRIRRRRHVDRLAAGGCAGGERQRQSPEPLARPRSRTDTGIAQARGNRPLPGFVPDGRIKSETEAETVFVNDVVRLEVAKTGEDGEGPTGRVVPSSRRIRRGLHRVDVR